MDKRVNKTLLTSLRAPDDSLYEEWGCGVRGEERGEKDDLSERDMTI